MMMAVCRNRLRDLETGRRLYPQRGAEIGRAVAMAHDYVAVASAENILFGHASLSAKMSILARVATGKIAGGGSLPGWTRKAFSPRRYLAAEMRRQAL